MEKSSDTSDTGINRRDLLKTGMVLAGGALLPVACKTPARAAGAKTDLPKAQVTTRRMLGGTLEGASTGLGVQNMSRKYETTIPSRPEMGNSIRTAFDHGVTLFDAAEAYGPFEGERILGEALVPVRNEVRLEYRPKNRSAPPWIE